MFPQINKKQMGQRLKRIMRRKKVAPKEVQQFLGLSCVQTVYRWMEGVNVPCIDHLYALSILLEVTLDELVAGNFGRSDAFVSIEKNKAFFVKEIVGFYEAGTMKHGKDKMCFLMELCTGISLLHMGTYYGKADQLLRT